MALIPTKMRLRRDTTSNWAAINPVLDSAETAWESDSRIMRVGDGITAFMDLPRYPVIKDPSEVGLWAPAGTIIEFARDTAPSGFLVADGAILSRAAYPDLFEAIGTTHGAGDGSTTFQLPDYRGEFLRGADQGRGLDVNRAIGSRQADAILGHSHGWSGSIAAVGGHGHGAYTNTTGAHTHYMWGQSGTAGAGTAPLSPDFIATTIDANRYGAVYTDVQGAHSHNITVNAAGEHSHGVTGTVASTGGPESRPRNMSVLICIKT